ncbi:MAG: trypsin-like peptidase domain-containing protein [Verrucomicrobiota bacterium]
MLPAIKRIFSLLCVFVIFFVLVTLLKTWQAGGDFASLVPDFLKSDEKKSREAFTPSEKAALNLSDVEMISRLNQEYARLTKAVVPSVVSINTAGIRTEELVDFFGRARVRSHPTQGQGSGVIVSKEGHIITNHHVIAGQQEIRITLHGGKTYSATMIGEDTLLDIAVIKIDSNETFTPLKLGDSSLVEVGQLVFAIGNPFGLGETVTQGIISAKERSLSDNQRDLFQTDAAINPGNSGGPLVNLTGEIIGINVAIFSVDKNNPSFQGVGFSIPSNEVKESLEQIIKRGKPIRGYLGVRMRDLDATISHELGYHGQIGSAVYVITPGSPAELAGLKPGDVILKYNEEEITNTRQIISLVQRSKIDEVVKLQIWRKGEIMNLEATIRESVSIHSAQNQTLAPDGEINLGILNTVGIKVRNLSGIEARRGFGGVVATMIAPNTLASGLILPDDLVIAVNNSQINNSNEFYTQLAASIPLQETIIHLIREGQPQRVILPKL